VTQKAKAESCKALFVTQETSKLGYIANIGIIVSNPLNFHFAKAASQQNIGYVTGADHEHP